MQQADNAQLCEARLILSFAARALSRSERMALNHFAYDIPESKTAAELGITRGGVWEAKKRALAKMRRELARVQIRSTEDLL